MFGVLSVLVSVVVCARIPFQQTLASILTAMCIRRRRTTFFPYFIRSMLADELIGETVLRAAGKCNTLLTFRLRIHICVRLLTHHSRRYTRTHVSAHVYVYVYVLIDPASAAEAPSTTTSAEFLDAIDGDAFE